ncbi:MAG: FAD-dependent oxidoreductase, partial [Solirubrobacteraceae bacterium]|nr:FAD-dependent oxidoreductase [Solirubrobacteraceae bacterium]
GSIVRAAASRAWDLSDEDGIALGSFDAVIVTAPAPQTAELVRVASPALAERAGSVAFEPCWSVMAAWNEPLDLPFNAAAGHGLTWAVSDGAKPGRDDRERWVLQADDALSTALLEQTPEAVGRDLLDRFAALAGRPLPEPGHVAAHRWLYSRPRTPLDEPFLRDGTLLMAGDWCGGRTAGDAVRSGRAAAAALIA